MVLFVLLYNRAITLGLREIQFTLTTSTLHGTHTGSESASPYLPDVWRTDVGHANHRASKIPYARSRRTSGQRPLSVSRSRCHGAPLASLSSKERLRWSRSRPGANIQPGIVLRNADRRPARLRREGERWRHCRKLRERIRLTVADRFSN